MQRTRLIAGNWKMNKTVAESKQLATELVNQAKIVQNAEIIICPTYLVLDSVSKIVKGSNIKLGAQDVHFENDGAYTGKISVSMLKEIGVEYVILGHSEQRIYFHETNQIVNQKVKKVLSENLKAIVCVGETLEEREGDKTNQVVESQLQDCYENLSADDVANTVVAYEPVWAIGTGKVASDEQAQEVHAFIRQWFKKQYSEQVANFIHIQYGGSMKPNNAQNLLSQPDIDGGLIGGAALVATDFLGIINA